MRVGIGLGNGTDVAARAVAAEALGFDYAFTGEHLFFHGPTPNAFVSLAAAAGATERIGLLSAVTLVALYPAVAVAKMGAWLDDVSSGRFHLGVGVGGEFPAEFAAAGVPHGERGARTDEALEVVTRLFGGERVTFTGRWAVLDDLGLQPPPARPGGPPIWVGGRRDASQRRVGRWGDVWMPYMVAPEQLAKGLSGARAQAVACGRAAEAVDGSLFCFVTVDADGERARRVAAEVVGGIYRQDFSRRLDYLVAGTPAECAERLMQYAAAGASSVQVTLACPPAEESAMLALLAAEVLPRLRPPAPAATAR
jgi:alkanesulfonate monooxygenase SsuD/methylene tetrahydromethanopterin reductase-like flavin-dependent oxidoreductase (luciferase family)